MFAGSARKMDSYENTFSFSNILAAFQASGGARMLTGMDTNNFSKKKIFVSLNLK